MQIIIRKTGPIGVIISIRKEPFTFLRKANKYTMSFNCSQTNFLPIDIDYGVRIKTKDNFPTFAQ